MKLIIRQIALAPDVPKEYAKAEALKRLKAAGITGVTRVFAGSPSTAERKTI